MLRHLSLLDFWISQLRQGSIDDRSRDLLRLGIYQLFCLNVPAHAAVFETVNLAPKTGRSFVNAILRSAVRQSAELQADAAKASLAIRSSHPEFLIERWTNAFGAGATEQLCAWNNEPPAVYARVNAMKATVEQFVSVDSTREALAERPNFVRLATVPVDALERGECYIQDPSTSVACELLDPQPGETVLDACAAPGGKTGYLAELMKDRGTLIACDRAPERLKLLASNLQRLGATTARVLQQDWVSGTIVPEISQQRFDRILIDAPCSNTGVMRRRVDVRWRLCPDDFATMAAEQLRILRAVIPLLKPGGSLVYSTCSVEAEENAGVVAEVLKEVPFLELAAERAVLPFRDGFDGAYAAKLVRSA